MNEKETPAWRDMLAHEDEGQVKLDVNRSFIYYPTSMLGHSLADSFRLSMLIFKV